MCWDTVWLRFIWSFLFMLYQYVFVKHFVLRLCMRVLDSLLRAGSVPCEAGGCGVGEPEWSGPESPNMLLYAAAIITMGTGRTLSLPPAFVTLCYDFAWNAQSTDLLIERSINSSSNTGMEQGSCDKAVHLSSYPVNTSEFTLIMGPAARIRPKRVPEEFYSCESILSLIASDLFHSVNYHFICGKWTCLNAMNHALTWSYKQWNVLSGKIILLHFYH